MKKLSLFLLLLSASVLVMAKGPAITFEKTTHDFGQIDENGGTAKYEFVFENTGDEPLIISNARASCGCTTPEWTKTPIEPGQKGIITVGYHPKGRGSFSKGVTVTSNVTDDPTLTLYIKGEVITKEQE